MRDYPPRIEIAVALSVGSPQTAVVDDVFHVAAANANIQQVAIRKLRQFARCVSLPVRCVSTPSPSAVRFRDHSKETHLRSISDAPNASAGRKPVVTCAPLFPTPLSRIRS
jgi:hypothetical protein